jgi:hypothetical protein
MTQIATQAPSRAQSALIIVRRHMYTSLAVGAVPVPWLDLAVLTGLHLKMLDGTPGSTRRRSGNGLRATPSSR